MTNPAPTVEILRYAGVPADQITRSVGRLVVLLAQRYGLDPALKHVEVIPARGGLQVYITADGWRYIADRSGELDGLTFQDVTEGEHGWRATALVWRKDCSHPFEGRAGAGFTEGITKDGTPIKLDDPEAMAMTRATRRALKNGFSAFIRADDVEERVIDPATDTPLEGPAIFEIPEPQVPEPQLQSLRTPSSVPTKAPRRTSGGSQTAAHQAVAGLDDDARAAFLDAHGVTYEQSWPAQVVDDALALPF